MPEVGVIPPVQPNAAYKQAQLSARGFKSWVTRKAKECEEAANYLLKNPSKYAATQLDESFVDFKIRGAKLENAYLECVQVDNVGEEQRWEVALGELEQEFSHVRRHVMVSMEAYTGAMVPPQQQAPAGGAAHVGRFPINDTLRPPILSLNNSPVELRQWTEKLRSFFTSNTLATAPIPEQQSYVRQFIDSDLDVRLEIRLDDSIEIFGDNGVVSFIQEEFARRYPLFSRRLEYFRYQRQTGQSASNFVAKLVQLSFEADLQSLKTDEIQVFRVLTGIKEDQLLGKLLDLKEMTFANVQQKITQFEVNRASKASVSSNQAASGGQARQVTSGPSRPSTQQRSSASKSGPLTPADLKGKCGTCGSPKHMKKDCPSKDKALCLTCNKTGHWKSVCLAEFYKNRTGGAPGNSSKPSYSTAAGGGAQKVQQVSDDSYTKFQNE